MIRINKNESPYRALTEEEIAKIAIDTHFNEYAEDEYEQLQKVYADFNDLDPDLIAFANGSDEWIQKSIITLGEGPILVLEPDFEMYTVYAGQFSRDIISIPCKKDYSFDYETVLAVLKEHQPSVFIFSQPNNPFGYLHPLKFIKQAAKLLKEHQGYLIIDEAYGEFVEDPPCYPKGDHVIRLRTLSKVYGLAGLRVGVAISTKPTIEKLTSISHPYPVNTYSLNVARYLLEQTDRLTDFIQLNRDLSKKLHCIFKEEVGDVISMLDSQTNFLFTYGEYALGLGNWVQEHGYQPRMYPDKPHLTEIVRYSIAGEKKLNELRFVLRKWREQHGRK